MMAVIVTNPQMTGVPAGALVAVVPLLLVAGWAVVAYNWFVQHRAFMAESWAQIDVELTRRLELIPNLVATVQGYAAHEQETFRRVAEARARALGAGSAPSEARAEAESTVTQAMRGLLAVAEAYPALQASANFLSLQAELAETENRLAAARRLYNGNIRAYNARVDTIPTRFIARLCSFAAAEYFAAEEGTQKPPTLRL